MPDKDESMTPLRKLRERIENEMEQLGLKVHHIAFVPQGPADENDFLQLAVFVTGDALETLEEREQKKYDSEFEAMFATDEQKPSSKEQKDIDNRIKQSIQALMDDDFEDD